MDNEVLTESQFYSLVGERIKELRKRNNLDQESLAKQLGLSRTSLVNIEKARQRPSVFQIWSLARILGATVLDLLPPNYLKINESKPAEGESKQAEQDMSLVNFLLHIRSID